MLPDEMQPPKTRYNSRDRSKTRSISSSRLKSFPTEKIKKLDNQPSFSPELNNTFVQNPRETDTLFANSIRSNNGQGDAIPATLSSYQQSKGIANTADQQQIVTNHQQLCQTNPHSENLLARPIASLEKHPFVSNMQGSIVCDRSLQNPSAMINQPVIMQTPSTQVTMSQTQQSSNNSHAVIDQNRNKTAALINECERQPIGSQSAVDHKQIFIQPKQAALNDRCARNCQNVYHAHNQLHGPFQQNSQQINEQTQHNAYHQQMLPQPLNQMPPSVLDQRQHIRNNSGAFYAPYNQQLSATQVSGHGMTSPQDMTVNQMRLIQRNLHNQNLGYPVNLQPAWPNNNPWMQTTNQQHLHQQPPQQWQYYHQDANFNQKDSRSQGQSNPSQNHESTNQQQSTAKAQQNDRRKKLQFTTDMIRDQELLVSTMRQQGISEEVMRRQFEALLNEQQKHLVYLSQFQQEEDMPDIKKIRLVQRRLEKDEKPEWMIHITPPRISHNEIEKVKAAQRDQEKKQYLTDSQLPEEVNRTVTARQQDYSQQKKQEMNEQALPQQMYVHMNPHQLWQQQMTNWPYKNEHQTVYNYTNSHPYGHQKNTLNNMYQQANPTFNKYIPCNMNYNPYYSLNSEEPKNWQNKEHNSNSSNPIDNQRLSMDFAHFEQNKGPSVEPFSLRKMRMYKEMIRPQKRNNGLQDPNTIQKVLETLKNPSSKKGLEYLANVAKNKPIVRLNGVQERNEIPEDMQTRPPVEASSPQPRKQISANGVENTRNPNNPVPSFLRPKRADEPAMKEYPRQKQSARISYNMQAEKENGTVANNNDQQRWQPRDHVVSYASNAKSIPYDRQNVPVAQYPGVPPQHYHQMQQYYLNGHNLAGHNGGQGDVVSMHRPDVPTAVRIDRASGDIGEKSNTEGTTKHVDMHAMQGANAYGQPEIRETRTIGGITYLARKPEYAPTNLVISPDKLIASRHLQPPRIF